MKEYISIVQSPVTSDERVRGKEHSFRKVWGRTGQPKLVDISVMYQRVYVHTYMCIKNEI